MVKYQLQKCFYLLFFAVLLACTTEKSNKDETEIDVADKPELVVTDSIVIEHVGRLIMTDYDRSNQIFLCYDLSTNEILTVGRHGSILTKFMRETNDDIGYGIHQANPGVGFYGDSSIVVSSLSGIYFYTFSGDLLRKIGNSNNSGYPNLNMRSKIISYDLNEERYVLASLNGDDYEFAGDQPEFYDLVRQLTIVNLDKEIFSMEIGFEKGSLYKNEFRYAEQSAYYEINPSGTELYIIYNYDPQLFVYDLVTFDLKRTISTEPDFFKVKEKARFGEKMPLFESFLLNSRYYGFHLFEDRLILEYHDSGLKEADIGQRPVTPEVGMKLNRAAIKNMYVQIFDNEKKTYGDLKVPAGLAYLMTVLDRDKFLFSADRNLIERDYEVFYVCELKM